MKNRKYFTTKHQCQNRQENNSVAVSKCLQAPYQDLNLKTSVQLISFQAPLTRWKAYE
jgi:hypothetical protein